VQEARWKADHGEAPTDDAVREWNRVERRRLAQAEDDMREDEQLRLAKKHASLGGVKTTAEPRPTAYIPEEYGIPKPYGALAPFKPSELGSSMRHIRPPQPQPIEI